MLGISESKQLDTRKLANNSATLHSCAQRLDTFLRLPANVTKLHGGFLHAASALAVRRQAGLVFGTDSTILSIPARYVKSLEELGSCALSLQLLLQP